MRWLPGRNLNWIVIRSAPDQRTRIANGAQVLAATAATWYEAGVFDLDYVMLSGILGIPGFSGDLAELTPEIRKQIAEYVSFYKEKREFFVNSHVFLLTEPNDKIMDYEKYMTFQLQGDQTTESLVFVFSHGASRRGIRRFRLQDLDPAKMYRVRKLFTENPEEVLQSGADLMRYGLKAVTPENQHVCHIAALYQISEA